MLNIFYIEAVQTMTHEKIYFKNSYKLKIIFPSFVRNTNGKNVSHVYYTFNDNDHA